MRIRTTLAVVLLASLSLVGQVFISAKAGLVNYEEGMQATSPRQLQTGEVFSSPNRAELLMMPGTFVRLERSTEVRMGSTSVTQPGVELLSGLISVEVNDLSKDSSVAISWDSFKDANAIQITHRGIYRFEVSQDDKSLKVMVQTGQLAVPGYNGTINEGHEIVISSGGISAPQKFNRKNRDDFDLWSSNRSQQLSASSYRTASSVGNSYSSTGLYQTGGYACMNSWGFNPYMSSYTYVPCQLRAGPWGWYYYSPLTVYMYPQPYYYYYSYYGAGASSAMSRSQSGWRPGSGAVPGRLPAYNASNAGPGFSQQAANSAPIRSGATESSFSSRVGNSNSPFNTYSPSSSPSPGFSSSVGSTSSGSFNAPSSSAPASAGGGSASPHAGPARP